MNTTSHSVSIISIDRGTLYPDEPEEWQRQIEQNDQNLTRRVSEEMIKQEAEFAEHRRTCGAVRGQIGVLIADHEKSINVFALLSERIAERMGPEDRPVAGGSSVTIPPINVRKVAFDIPTTVSSWVDWAQVLIERGALKAVPPDVEDLLELNSAALKERETSEKSPQKVFLVRAMRNYKSAIERLQKDSSTLPSGWQPVWDAEKTLLAYSGDRPASRRWMEEESFRVALANKAYVYDALIRLRGGMTETYDRFEMAYYLSQMIWCARKLGHPFADEIETLANTYLRGLSENRALAAN